MQINKLRKKDNPRDTNKKDDFYQTKHWRRIVADIWVRDGYQCQLCKEKGIIHPLVRGTRDLNQQGTIDHKEPRPIGSAYDPIKHDNKNNLWLIGSNHHASKSSKERRGIKKNVIC